MKSLPLASVIIPAYNCEQYISETLDSLLGQDYPSIEIIVVNDGSKDGTLEILKGYGEQIILIDQPNAGPPSARNNGIKSAKGDFISFCDSDDIWAPQKVSEQIKYLNAHPEVGMVCASWIVWNPSQQGEFSVPNEFKILSLEDSQKIVTCDSGWIYHQLLLDCVCLTSAVMFRRDIVDKVGFFELELWNGDDYDYWLRTSRITEIHRLKSELVLYRILPQSVNRTPTEVNYGYEVIQKSLAKWGLIDPVGREMDAKIIKNRLAAIQFNFGYMHLKFGNARIAVRSFWGAVMQKPLWYLPWFYLLLGFWKQTLKS